MYYFRIFTTTWLSDSKWHFERFTSSMGLGLSVTDRVGKSESIERWTKTLLVLQMLLFLLNWCKMLYWGDVVHNMRHQSATTTSTSFSFSPLMCRYPPWKQVLSGPPARYAESMEEGCSVSEINFLIHRPRRLVDDIIHQRIFCQPK